MIISVVAGCCREAEPDYDVGGTDVDREEEDVDTHRRNLRVWTEEQVHVAAWRSVTNAVHAKGGKIVTQLWHTGRISQPSFGTHTLLKQSGNLPSVSASATAMVHPRTGAPLKTVTYAGGEECATPRALRLDETGT